MKTQHSDPLAGNRHAATSRGFTLIELLIVIAIIGVLAAFTIPVIKSVKRNQFVNQAKAQMAGIETAIEQYKATYGFYPPGNSAYNPAVPATLPDAYFSPLYYELLGTTNNNGVYQTLDGSASISVSQLATGPAPGPLGVSGFLNCSKPGAGEDSVAAKDFLPGLKPNEVGTPVTNNFYPAIPLTVLAASAGGPDPNTAPLGSVNPWRYVCPGTNNPTSYDLWVQLVISGKKNLVCNWSKEVQINSPLP